MQITQSDRPLRVVGGNSRINSMSFMRNGDERNLNLKWNTAGAPSREMVHKQLARAAATERMTGTISHDLRNHLSAIQANVEFLSSRSLHSEDRQEIFDQIDSAIQGMTDMLDSLLHFAKTGQSLRPERLPLRAIVEDSVRLLRSHPEASDVSISVHVEGSPVIRGDKNKLGRAIYNLLLNACQAARRGVRPPQVILQLKKYGTNVVIDVIDSGPGVAESMRALIFKPFISEGREHGTGLGLSLTQEIAKEHGGSITLLHTVDNWTLFRLTLPALEMRRSQVDQELIVNKNNLQANTTCA